MFTEIDNIFQRMEKGYKVQKIVLSSYVQAYDRGVLFLVPDLKTYAHLPSSESTFLEIFEGAFK